MSSYDGVRVDPEPVGKCLQTISADYHTDYSNGDSHSSLELFRESPAKYAAIRVFQNLQQDPPSQSARIGLALHALLFEYDKEWNFELRQATKRGIKNNLWYSGRKSASQKVTLSEKEMQLLCGMWLSLVTEEDALNLLVQQPGWNERIFTAVDQKIQLQIKCKPDRVLENGLVVDLKTVDGAVDPSAWSRTLAKWGYHRQAAFYLDVLALAGQRADLFVFVAISKDAPHEIGMYVLDEDSVEQGRRENRDLLEKLAECRRTGRWKHDWQGKILTAGVPRWAIER